MYKAGYDPNALVSFFEKVETDEKKEPGTIPKVFATHPPTPDRIEAIQKEIATILPARDQYIVTTSEFDKVKHRLQLIEANVKVKNNNPNRPTLRKRTGQNKGGNTQPPDMGGETVVTIPPRHRIRARMTATGPRSSAGPTISSNSSREESGWELDSTES